MKQRLLGIEAEVELGRNDNAVLSKLLNAGVVILPLSDKKIRISVNADQVNTATAILIKQEIPKCLAFFNRSNSSGGIQKTYVLTSGKLTDPTSENCSVPPRINRKWGHYYYDTLPFDGSVQKKGEIHV